MFTWLPQVRLLHVSCVIASGCLFLLRGLPLLAGSAPFDPLRLRRLSYAVDSLLLAAAITLMIGLHAWPTTQAWIAVKLLLVLAYIVLGSLALKRGRTPAIRRACFIVAVAIYLSIVAIARGHDPLAPLRQIGVL